MKQHRHRHQHRFLYDTCSSTEFLLNFYDAKLRSGENKDVVIKMSGDTGYLHSYFECFVNGSSLLNKSAVGEKRKYLVNTYKSP